MGLRSIQYKVVECLYGVVIVFQCKTANPHHLQGLCSQTKMLLMLELQCMKLWPLAKNGVNGTTDKWNMPPYCLEDKELHFSCQNSYKNNISFCHTNSSCVEGCPALGFHCFHIFKQKFPFNTLKRLYNHYAFLDRQTLPQLIITHGPFHCTTATHQLPFSVPKFLLFIFLTEAFRRHGGSKVWTQV